MADTEAARRVGFWSAVCCLFFSLAYIFAQLLEWLGVLGSAGGPESSSTPFGLAILLTPSLLLAPAFVVLMSALHSLAPPDRKVWSQTALAFAIIYATLVSPVYFVQLTLVAPRMASGDLEGIEFLIFVPYRSFLFAVDLLGYSFMSVATLFATFALPNVRLARLAKAGLLLNGLLLPFLALQMFMPDLIQVAALWGVSFPAAMLGLAILLRRKQPL